MPSTDINSIVSSGSAAKSGDMETSELLDGIYQDTIKPSLEEQPVREFKPWHKPRKHYLRLYQWCDQVNKLIKRLGYRPGAVLTYLGLPGEDLLDIRAMQGVCDSHGLKLRYLGFNSAARRPETPYETNLAEHEVFALSFIHPASMILADHFEKIAQLKSLGFERVRQFESFDIINLDLCDSLVSPAKRTQYFDALYRICDLQLRNRGGRPWLMFITTRAGRDELNADLKSKLLDCVLANIRASATFAQFLNDKGLTAEAIRAEMDDISHVSHDLLLELLGLAIGKWLLRIMNSSPGTTVRVGLLPSYRYRVKNDQPDMLSLGFEFELLIKPAEDPSGIAKLPFIIQPSIPTEFEQALELLRMIGTVTDVDQLLWDDSDLNNKIIQKCAKLMVAAHYDHNDYVAWATGWSSREKYRAAVDSSSAE